MTPDGSRRALAMALVASVLATSASAAMVDLEPSRDNTLYQEGATLLSNGAGEYLFVGRTSGNTNPLLGLAAGTRRALLHFDVASQIPASAMITSAALSLSVTRENVSGTRTLSLHRVSADWGEGSSDALDEEGLGALATASDATWVERFHGPPVQLWLAPGGDFSPMVSAAVSLGSGESTALWSSSGLAEDVQAFLDDPASNFGWLARDAVELPGEAFRFASREHATLALRPLLRVEYVPEPAVHAPALVLALAGLAAARRRSDAHRSRKRSTPF